MKKIFIIGFLLIILISVNSIFAGDLLISLFYDFLQGRPSGIVNIHVRVPEDATLYLVTVWNLTVGAKPGDRVVFFGVYRENEITLRFKIYRYVFDQILDKETGLLRARFLDHVYVIKVSTPKSKYYYHVIFEPKFPLMDVNAVPVNKVTRERELVLNVNEHVLSYPNPEPELMGVTQKTHVIEVGEVHSIEGLTVKWGFDRSDLGKYILIEAYHRDSSIGEEEAEMFRAGTYDLNSLVWSPPSSLGKVETRVETTVKVAVSDGVKRRVDGQVLFSHEMYYTDLWPLANAIEFDLFMIPLELRTPSLGRTVSCNECGSQHPDYASSLGPGYQHDAMTTGQGTGYIVFQKPLAFTISISVTAPIQYTGFNVIIGFSFTFNVSTQKIYYTTQPKIDFIKNNGKINDTLWVWRDLDDDTLIHFSWI